MADWTIRKAQPQDAPALAACFRRAYAEHATRIKDLPDVTGGLDQDILNHAVWVAVRKAQIVGGLVLILGPDHAKLANVAVDPAASGTGLGRALIETAEATCRRLQLLNMRLSTHVDMQGNLALYRHLGWVETGRKGNSVQMQKPL